jgi:hypothetical protein
MSQGITPERTIKYVRGVGKKGKYALEEGLSNVTLEGQASEYWQKRIN